MAEPYKAVTADALIAEVVELRRKVADYERGITWFTDCVNCAKAWEMAYNETYRADEFERRVKELEEKLKSA